MVYEKSAFCVAGREVIVMNSRGGAEGCDAEACAVKASGVELVSSFLRSGEWGLYGEWSFLNEEMK
jgi:hypothetical protein